MENRICEKNKINGVSYAFTDAGIELPVLDITHPLFTESINQEKLDKMLEDIVKNGEKRADKFKKMPGFIKNFLANHSYIMAGFLLKDTDDRYLSGISTLLLKLGPGFIGKGTRKLLDRLASKSFGAVTLRMRVRDISMLQADLLIQPLKKEPEKGLCFVNIAGGTACDSINTLIIIQKEYPSLLKDREIEINVLDVDTSGPAFANKCLESLKMKGACFHDLRISFRHINYNWSDPAELTELLTKRGDWLTICSSEGGLFEYGEDEEILQNLQSLCDNTSDDMRITGTLVRDKCTVDPALLAGMKMTTIKFRLLGIGGLINILRKTKWVIERIIEENPRYIVFSLKKNTTVKQTKGSASNDFKTQNL